MSTADASEDIRSFLLSVREFKVSFAAEANVADYGSQAGWELDSRVAEAILPQCCECTDSMRPRQDAERESVLCSLREGMISEGTEAF